LPDLIVGPKSALSARYVVERELGRGGMAVVYLAMETKHERRVALKVMHPEMAHAIGTERFLREIRLAASLNHPNIVPVFDSGEIEGSLYFTMPYIDGETLRARLDREPKIPVDEAVRVAAEIADALAYAHVRGIVHRDIKPENIFLANGHAYIGDFGIAVAASVATADRITRTGFVVGTPAYMSPEQRVGAADLDGRSDEYSLAAVLFEMLAGRSPLAVATANNSDPVAALMKGPPSVRKVRREVPTSVDRALNRALAPVPADRYASIAEFRDAIGTGAFARAGGAGIPTAIQDATSALLHGRAGAAVGIVAVAALLFFAASFRQKDPPQLDPDMYAVMPFLAPAPDAAAGIEGEDAALFLREALNRWSGIRIADFMRVNGSYSELGKNPSIDRVLAAGKRLGAANLAWGEIRVRGDSLVVAANLYDVGRGEPLRAARVTLPRSAERFASVIVARFAELADSLLLPTNPALARDAKETSSLPALQAYIQGHRFLGDWNLFDAEAQFDSAARLDPRFTHAHFWVAQTKQWFAATRGAINWQTPIARAVQDSLMLSSTERLVAHALLDLAHGRYESACARYREILKTEPESFTALFGLGDCLHRDPTVLSDPGSPTQWRFRVSEGEAIRSIVAALEVAPRALTGFRGRAFSFIESITFTTVNNIRQGRRVVGTDTTMFAAFPSIDADSVAFFPVPFSELRTAGPPPTHGAAVSRNRDLLRRLTRRWVNAYPDSPDALQAHAAMLEASGQIEGGSPQDTGAIDLIRAARRLRGPVEPMRLAADEFRLLLKAGRWDAAARFGDSLIAASPIEVDDDVQRLAVVAAVLGRANETATVIERVPFAVTDGTGRDLKLPSQVTRTFRRLDVFAATERSDSALAVLQRLDDEMRRSVPVGERESLRRQLVSGPSSALFSTGRFPVVHGDPGTDWLQAMQAAYREGKLDIPRNMADAELAKARTSGVVTSNPSVLFGSAKLLLMMNDTTRAVALLDELLGAIPSFSGRVLGFVTNAATIVPAAALRARLADRVGDRSTAARMAQVVVGLWRDPDPELNPVVAEMRGLASRNKAP
jgi:tRNA A-37 threonylcarbamoyl transferase component Bud32/tetratricopeptide (TPR) repeat protein